MVAKRSCSGAGPIRSRVADLGARGFFLRRGSTTAAERLTGRATATTPTPAEARVLAFLTCSYTPELYYMYNIHVINLRQCSNQTHSVPVAHGHCPATQYRPDPLREPELRPCSSLCTEQPWMVQAQPGCGGGHDGRQAALMTWGAPSRAPAPTC